MYWLGEGKGKVLLLTEGIIDASDIINRQGW